MSNPNIFNYATSELSQDAIICYILEWAKSENKVKNNNLHELGIKFIDSIFNNFEHVKNIEKPDKYQKIDIKKQYKNIDILCIVNDKYSIIIEDKTNTKNHSDQLKRYFEEIKKDFSCTKILCIYFKTGDQSNYDNVKKNGYSIYSRKDFLNVLNNKNYKNDIIENYTDYLQNIEDSINSYKTTPIEDWSWNAWKGFYIELKDKLNDGSWNYVSNPRGGFLGFWWNWSDKKTYRIYLQIDHKSRKITVKLHTKTDTKIEKSIINKWKKHIEYSKNDIFIIKPKVVRSGKSVTIGIVKSEFRITNGSRIIDFNKTINFIEKIQKIKLDKFESV
jgi:hypothetical protein